MTSKERLAQVRMVLMRARYWPGSLRPLACSVSPNSCPSNTGRQASSYPPCGSRPVLTFCLQFLDLRMWTRGRALGMCQRQLGPLRCPKGPRTPPLFSISTRRRVVELVAAGLRCSSQSPIDGKSLPSYPHIPHFIDPADPYIPFGFALLQRMRAAGSDTSCCRRSRIVPRDSAT